MSTLAEIEAAVKKLPASQQEELIRLLTARRAQPRRRKAAVAKTLEAKEKAEREALAAHEAYRQRMLALNGGKPVLTKKGWKLLSKMIRGE